MTEVLFYHLERRGLDEVLPGLLEKCLERGWRTVVQTGSRERCEALNQRLWDYRDDSFLPHGTSGDGFDADQPVYLTDAPDNPNGATVRFLVDRADPPDLSPYERAVFVFDGRDADELADARQRWKAVKGAGFDLTYWQQSESGRWEKKA